MISNGPGAVKVSTYSTFKAENLKKANFFSDLCKHRNCKYGATCVIDAATGGAGCRCLHDCSDAEDDPVCGSDEVTYTNECNMRAAACMSRRVLVVQSHGECGKSDFYHFILY